ncbi:MAG TPA: pyruvate dehydrogenase (acetyl-transferring) E1 component subunit alpha [Acetomicrobium flavidum]|uniref:pyruvate dehydrogenase (acetyl-transferring) E1 component subunit alpha n=2 Tax=Acetomicrobium flavidum TaxID=49896 RepID=UPI002BC87995|nr:pyruvate dehydrogenase (acetyl-transferring) E1 component subunit alpha [Acetomicrobium flavidum]HPU69668.1 pyruvate dehydrogenase (acetyl-transferring) E1 component subunit alpha [Acetomicrobium flavidum]
MAIERETLQWMYRNMLTIRYFEERVAELFAAGKCFGFVHLYVGEEAVATGACANLRKDDYITSTHRGHGHLISKGGDLKLMMAELFGRRTGYCKGKGGSMHIADVELGILGANGIVGGGFPIAVGAGFTAKYKGTDQVAACFFGDGASNQGTFHEGLNMASIWKLPVIFINENNFYGISLSQRRSMNVPDVAARAAAYNIPGVVVDGNDVLAVYEAVQEAVKRARAGEGPTLIECKTYRYRGHFEGDPTVYRPEEEVREWKKKDPIPRFEEKLAQMGIMTEEQMKQVREEIAGKIEEAVKFAEESPWPSPEEVLEDVYA